VQGLHRTSLCGGRSAARSADDRIAYHFGSRPLGLNLFLSSFRFNRPVSSLYRAVLPFVGVLCVGLLIVSAVPSCSTVAVAKDLTAIRTKAEADNLPPRDLWMMECVQADSANPQPCSAADIAKYPGGSLGASAEGAGLPGDTTDVDGGCNPDFGDCKAAGP
jgi:C4-dicarboxylate transporter, DctM subunit